MTADHHTGASRQRAPGATLAYRPIALQLVAARDGDVMARAPRTRDTPRTARSRAR